MADFAFYHDDTYFQINPPAVFFLRSCTIDWPLVGVGTAGFLLPRNEVRTLERLNRIGGFGLSKLSSELLPLRRGATTLKSLSLAKVLLFSKTLSCLAMLGAASFFSELFALPLSENTEDEEDEERREDTDRNELFRDGGLGAANDDDELRLRPVFSAKSFSERLQEKIWNISRNLLRI